MTRHSALWSSFLYACMAAWISSGVAEQCFLIDGAVLLNGGQASLDLPEAPQ